MFLLIFSLASSISDCPEIKGCQYCDSDKTYCSTCDTHYIRDPDNSGQCICDYKNHYYSNYKGECEIPGKTNCEEGCSYCFTSDKCEECDKSKNFRLINKHCYCSESYNFNPEPVNGECVCKEGYGLEKSLECGKLEYGNVCSQGCESCLPRYLKCVNCKENFELKEGKCSCKEGYVLDLNTDKSKTRCLKIFPDSCPTGCNCDENNQVCLSCKDNFIPEYYSDLETIYNCIPAFECPAEISDGCQYCNETGHCMKCNDGFYFLSLNSSCIRRDVFVGKCDEFGCITCESELSESCLACESGFKSTSYNYINYCILESSDPKKIIYANIDDEKIIGKDKNVIQSYYIYVNINLNNIEAAKIRPYFYQIEENISSIYLNNDNSVPFKISLDNYKKDTLHIRLNDGAKPNPKITIETHYKPVNIDLQSSLASFEGGGTITLFSNDENKTQLDTITFNQNFYKFNVDKNLNINEINVYNDKNFFQVNSQNTRNNIKISISKLHMHVKSEITISSVIEVDTLIAESKGQIIAENIAVQNIEINCLASSIERIHWSHIEGNITGIPQSIKININPANKSIYSNDYSLPYLYLVSGENPEFTQNCEKWAKIYNDNPTDLNYNHAECSHISKYSYLYITHKEKKKSSKNKTAIIVGSVVACVVVVGVVVFLLVYFLVIKKNKVGNSSDQEN